MYFKENLVSLKANLMISLKFICLVPLEVNFIFKYLKKLIKKK